MIVVADGNGNNQIDRGNFTVWKANYDSTAGSGAGATANPTVPEPSTLATFLAVGLLLLLQWGDRCGQRLQATQGADN